MICATSFSLKCPDVPVAKFPARLRQPVEIFRRDGIDKILVGAVDKNPVGLHGEGQLRDDGVVSPAAERRVIWRAGVVKPVGGQIGRRHHVLDKFRDAQAGQQF